MPAFGNRDELALAYPGPCSHRADSPRPQRATPRLYSPRSPSVPRPVVDHDAGQLLRVDRAGGGGAAHSRTCLSASSSLLQLRRSRPSARRACVDGQRRGRGGRLAEDHEHRLHADRAVGDVRARQADRHQQVVALAALRARASGRRSGTGRRGRPRCRPRSARGPPA